MKHVKFVPCEVEELPPESEWVGVASEPPRVIWCNVTRLEMPGQQIVFLCNAVVRHHDKDKRTVMTESLRPDHAAIDMRHLLWYAGVEWDGRIQPHESGAKYDEDDQ